MLCCSCRFTLEGQTHQNNCKPISGAIIAVTKYQACNFLHGGKEKKYHFDFLLVTAFNGTQAVFEAVSPSLSRLSPLSFTDREVSRTCPQLVEVHGGGQPRNVIVLAVNLGVPLAHLG